jgi:MFS superfamily sulfate permease-like transporter
MAGFVVFLIALPLCLGISMASGFPPVSGILTAIVGGVIGTLVSNAQLTIKGPAAGLIVIALGAVTELGHGDPALGYRLALGVIVVAGVVQIAFGLLRAGIVAELFPGAAVHGLLAAIGVIILAKQTHTMLGVTPEAHTPLGQLAEIPHSVLNANPAIAIIGVVSIFILALWSRLPRRVRAIPSPLVVVLVAVPLAKFLGVGGESLFVFSGSAYDIGAKFLVSVPDSLLDAIVLPDFSAVATAVGVKYVILFSLIGSLESVLSARAVDLLDPYGRRANQNRDLVAVGLGNTIAAAIGGLPMISEIVRSSANVANGGRTKKANFFHALFLLAFVALAPELIRMLPLAALGAILAFTGYRLAAPREFAHVWHTGPDQLAVYVTTLVVTLLTDLLVGVAAGVALSLVLDRLGGVRWAELFRTNVDADIEEDGYVHLKVHGAAAFSNWLGLRRHILALPCGQNVWVDLSDTRVVDHTVLTQLEYMSKTMSEQGTKLVFGGVSHLRPVCSHPHATRYCPKRGHSGSQERNP